MNWPSADSVIRPKRTVLRCRRLVEGRSWDNYKGPPWTANSPKIQTPLCVGFSKTPPQKSCKEWTWTRANHLCGSAMNYFVHCNGIAASDSGALRCGVDGPLGVPRVVKAHFYWVTMNGAKNNVNGVLVLEDILPMRLERAAGLRYRYKMTMNFFVYGREYTL